MAEKEQCKRAWRMNCEQVAAYDTALEDKNDELTTLRCQFNKLATS